MAFPPDWPPGATDTVRSFRFFVAATATADFADNAYLYGNFPSANKPLPFIKAGSSTPIDVPKAWGGGKAPEDAYEGVPVPTPHYTPRFVIIRNLDPTMVLQVSFDGVNVHDEFPPDTIFAYEDRQEGGIAFRFKPGTNAGDFNSSGW